jgi:pyruvate kinase
VGVSLGIPVIVSATNALKIIEDNETITIDAQSGLVYKGEVKML